MTVRRLNYTNRQKIRRSDVAVAVQGASSPVARVDYRLAEYGFADDAVVFLEAYAPQESFGARVQVGLAHHPDATVELDLSQFSAPQELLFRLKVIAADGSGKLLGRADQLKASDEASDRTEGRSLLPVVSADLGHRLWWLELDETDQPTLLISERIEDYKAFARTPTFVWFVLPAILRGCLEAAVETVDEESEGDEGAATPLARWLKLGSTLARRSAPDATDDQQERDKWIEDAVSAFCHDHKLMQRYFEQEPASQ